jgi:hypothetical protein
VSLDDWQDQVLQGLGSGANRDEVLRLATAAAAGTDLAEWVASWDPALADLAGVLVTRWAARDEAVPGNTPSG